MVDVLGMDAVGGANQNNQANLFSIALKYKASESLGMYLGWAMTANGPAAHYDMGAGGRSVATDCHDAFAAAGDWSVRIPIFGRAVS